MLREAIERPLRGHKRGTPGVGEATRGHEGKLTS